MRFTSGTPAALLVLALGMAACSAPPAHSEPTVAHVASRQVLTPEPRAPVQVPMLVPLARSLVSMNVRARPGPQPTYLYELLDSSNRLLNVTSMRAFDIGQCVLLTYLRLPDGELVDC
jgi:hypothetical protein